MVTKGVTRRRAPENVTARNVLRGLETRRQILRAATGLFSAQGYGAVTMREIAGRAGCSHTAIYLYFKDKESLLEAIVFPALEELRAALAVIKEAQGPGVEEKLLQMGHAVIDFSLARRSLHRVVFSAGASRVDVPQREGSLNHARISVFRILSGLCGDLLGFGPEDPRTLAAGRVWFFMLNGIISTYEENTETTKALRKRLHDTFDLALRSCISGMQAQFARISAKGAKR
ncbi:MAG TPA: TetR/AcrR family transcriptional regulator [Spirochaetia bacterium]|nr:TetR/AcrR family transcriptional regulator [Spirochaetia bacterium]